MEELLGSCELLGSSSEFLDAGITSSEMAESSGSSSGSCEPTPEERDFLAALNSSSEERLGCQFRVCGNVVIDYIGS